MKKILNGCSNRINKKIINKLNKKEITTELNMNMFFSLAELYLLYKVKKD
jgi:hypothetical protein